METYGNEGRRRKRARTSETFSLEHADADTIFALLLAAIFNSHRPGSLSLIEKCLIKLNPSFLSQSPNPTLSLLPFILTSKRAEIAARGAEIVGAASLFSLEMNEQIALDGEIVKGLVSALGSSKRNVLMAACNAVLDMSTTSVARKRLLELSALESLMWEGFAHVALCCWNQSHKQPQYASFESVLVDLHVISVNLLHVAIGLLGNSDPTFRKACLAAAFSLPSDTRYWLDLNQRTIFSHLIDKINTESRFLEALRSIEVAIQKNEDPFQRIRWLRLLNPDGETIEGHDWNLSCMEMAKLFPLCVTHKEKVEAAFMHVKSRFCDEVLFGIVLDSYKMLLDKYRKPRQQYMDGMISLHCTS